ncbi:MAG: hypothetical protein BWX66_00992 [Deltaproteobacteria bacterium ADurb.Bin058]|nr:MAG: hypothetical protein BWX66_00992 [Deltaproteobacteria bacterium ADurb.Bin058]
MFTWASVLSGISILKPGPSPTGISWIPATSEALASSVSCAICLEVTFSRITAPSSGNLKGAKCWEAVSSKRRPKCNSTKGTTPLCFVRNCTLLVVLDIKRIPK